VVFRSAIVAMPRWAVNRKVATLTASSWLGDALPDKLGVIRKWGPLAVSVGIKGLSQNAAARYVPIVTSAGYPRACPTIELRSQPPGRRSRSLKR
jgi:hypothetical protein